MMISYVETVTTVVRARDKARVRVRARVRFRVRAEVRGLGLELHNNCDLLVFLKLSRMIRLMDRDRIDALQCTNV